MQLSTDGLIEEINNSSLPYVLDNFIFDFISKLSPCVLSAQFLGEELKNPEDRNTDDLKQLIELLQLNLTEALNLITILREANRSTGESDNYNELQK